MFNWRKGSKKPATGPDFSAVDSKEKAEQLHRKGDLCKLLLLPTEFGGQDIPPNVVYVPEFAVQMKARIDNNIIFPLAQSGKISLYRAEPNYEGDSFIPSSITITASEPGSFTAKVAIWGSAVKETEATT